MPPAFLWVLCGVSVLLLDHGAVAGGSNVSSKGEIHACQDPRFMAVRKGQTVRFYCFSTDKCYEGNNCTISWYIGNENGSVISYIDPNTDPHVEANQANNTWILKLRKIKKKQSGIYFCNIHTNQGKEIEAKCGTELMVLGYGNAESMKLRHIMKDAIIMVQMILILLFTLVPVILVMEMNKKRSVKLEDHTYEGLEAYQSTTYEDIQAVRTLSTKRMIGEHPSEE